MTKMKRKTKMVMFVIIIVCILIITLLSVAIMICRVGVQKKFSTIDVQLQQIELDNSVTYSDDTQTRSITLYDYKTVVPAEYSISEEPFTSSKGYRNENNENDYILFLNEYPSNSPHLPRCQNP